MIRGGLAEAMLLMTESPFKSGVKVRVSASGVVGAVLRATVVQRSGRNVLRVKVGFENGAAEWVDASQLELAQ